MKKAAFVLLALVLLIFALWQVYLHLLPPSLQIYTPFKFRPGKIDEPAYELKVSRSDGRTVSRHLYGVDPGRECFLQDFDTVEFKVDVFKEGGLRDFPLSRIYVRGLQSGRLDYRIEMEMNKPRYVAIGNYAELMFWDNANEGGLWAYCYLDNEETYTSWAEESVMDYLAAIGIWDGESELVALLGSGSWSHIFDIAAGGYMPDDLFYPPDGWEEGALIAY